MRRLVLPLCMLIAACAPMPQKALHLLPEVSLPEVRLQSLPGDQALKSVARANNEFANCTVNSAAGSCAPITGEPPAALVNDALCLLDVLKTTAGIGDTRTGLSLYNQLEIQFGFQGTSGSRDTLRFEVVRVRDSFSYVWVGIQRDWDTYNRAASASVVRLVFDRWFDECRAVEQSRGGIP